MRSPFNLSSLLGSSAIAIIISWVITLTTSGCRVGNYVERQEAADRWTGLYRTTPTAVTLTAIVGGVTRRQTLRIDQVPVELSTYMSDPVILYVVNLEEKVAAFYNKSQKGGGLPVLIGKDGATLGYSGSGSPQTLWKAFERCTDQLDIANTGKIVPAAEKRIEVDFTISRAIDGTQCTEALTDMMNCYQNISNCDGVASSAEVYQNQVTDYFGLYIDEGLFAYTELPNVQNIGYEVSYR